MCRKYGNSSWTRLKHGFETKSVEHEVGACHVTGLHSQKLLTRSDKQQKVMYAQLTAVVRCANM